MTSIVLKWRDINSSKVPISFRVYRSETPMDIENLPVAMADVDRTVFQYEDTTVEYGKTYYYRVSAITEENEEVSGELIATTKQSVYSTDGNTLYKYGSENNMQYAGLELDAGGNITASEVDHLGNIYVGTDKGTVLKYSNKGDLLWTVESGTNHIANVVVDFEQNVIFSENINLHKLDSNGIKLWTFTVDAESGVKRSNYGFIESVAIDRQDTIVMVTRGRNGTGREGYSAISRIDTNGKLENSWLANIDGWYSAPIRVDSQSNIYMAKGNGSNSRILVYGPDGVLFRESSDIYQRYCRVREIVVDEINGRFHLLLTQYDTGVLRSVDWNFEGITPPQEYRGSASCMCLDNEGNLYATDRADEDVNGTVTTLSKYDKDLNLVGSYRCESLGLRFDSLRADPGTLMVSHRILEPKETVEEPVAPETEPTTQE